MGSAKKELRNPEKLCTFPGCGAFKMRGATRCNKHITLAEKGNAEARVAIVGATKGTNAHANADAKDTNGRSASDISTTKRISPRQQLDELVPLALQRARDILINGTINDPNLARVLIAVLDRNGYAPNQKLEVTHKLMPHEQPDYLRLVAEAKERLMHEQAQAIEQNTQIYKEISGVYQQVPATDGLPEAARVREVAG